MREFFFNQLKQANNIITPSAPVKEDQWQIQLAHHEKDKVFPRHDMLDGYYWKRDVLVSREVTPWIHLIKGLGIIYEVKDLDRRRDRKEGIKNSKGG